MYLSLLSPLSLLTRFCSFCSKSFPKRIDEIEELCYTQDVLFVVMGGLGGNLSQELSNFNCMFQHPFKIIFVSDINIVFLLKPGHHIVHCFPNLKCGLIPLGGPCEEITTEGLKWNLSNERFSL
jgi:thiamine pyrophosphokinase